MELKPSGVIVATTWPCASSSRMVLRSVITTPLICGDQASLTIEDSQCAHISCVRVPALSSTMARTAEGRSSLVMRGIRRSRTQRFAMTGAGGAAAAASMSCQRRIDSVPSCASTSAVRLSTQSPQLQ